MSLIRGDLAEDDVAVLEGQFPGLVARLATAAGNRGPGVQITAPPAGAVDNPGAGAVAALHTRRGCEQRAYGLQPAQSRGAAAAPEPYREPSSELAAPERELPSAADRAGGGRAGEFIAALGAGWPLTAAQRARLGPAVLDTGWAPKSLAAVAGADTRPGSATRTQS